MAGRPADQVRDHAFTQNTAGYYPLPFAKRCRIEWIGDMDRAHFYHIQVRLYEPGTRVETFHPEDLETYAKEIDRTAALLVDAPGSLITGTGPLEAEFNASVPGGEHVTLLRGRGPAAIQTLSIRVHAGDPENALRNNILRITFDGASRSQVQAPLGDFFVTAPGINPFNSLPFTVRED
jgi:hypothetical protein